MHDPRISKMAKTIVQYALKLEKGDKFLIRGNEAVIPLMKELYKEALLVGALPEVKVEIEELREILLKNGSDEQISYASPIVKEAIAQYDAYIRIEGSFHKNPLQSIPSEKIQMNDRALSQLVKSIASKRLEGKMKNSLTLYPTVAGAMDANMSLSEYEDFVYRACFIDREDPAAEWLKLKEHQEGIINYLKDKDVIRVLNDGTDLTLKVGGRKWENSCGTTNFPSGEVYTGPVETSLNGYISYNLPTVKSGKKVDGIRLEFKDGKVVHATAKVGEEHLLALIATDEGASYVGEFAIGTNENVDRFTGNILFDEKMGGTIHIALGSAYKQTGSKNESNLHWDMILDMKNGGELYADGELFYQNGKFLKGAQ